MKPLAHFIAALTLVLIWGAAHGRRMPLIVASFLLGVIAAPPSNVDDDEAGSARPSAAALKEDDEVAAKVRPSRQAAAQPDPDDEKPKVGSEARTEQNRDDDEEEGRAQPSSRIVVTAHRLDAARTQIDAGLGATVYLLTNDTIENRPGGETGRLSDVLTQAPGVTLSGTVLTVRGSAANQVRINNVIVPEAISDPADLLGSRLAETTRLITGTLPAQFGFAPAGVISITTKNGLYQHGGQVELFGGTDGMVEPAIEWGDSIGPTSLFASGEMEHDRSTIADANGNRARDRRAGIDGLGFADHVIDQSNRVSFIVGGAHERHDIGRTSIEPGTESNDDAYGVATYQHSRGGFTLQTSLFAGIGSDEARFIGRTRERRSSWGTQIDGTNTLGVSNNIRFGLLATRSVTRELQLGGDRPTEARTSVGIYAQDEWKLAPSLTLNSGVRLEWLRGFSSGATIEPRTSVVWQSRDGLTVHLGYARYAAAQPLGEQTSSAPLPDERDDYVDGGVQQKLGPLTLSADAYWRWAHNYIVERQIIGSAVPTSFAFDRTRVRGVELSGTYARRATTAWVNVALSRASATTIVGGEQIFEPATLVVASATSVPLASDRPVTATAGVTQRLGKFSLSGDVVVSSGAVRTLRFADPNGDRRSAYALFSVAAVYHARIAGQSADLRLDLTNLTNAHYATSDASNLEGGWTHWGRGRALTIGVEQGF